MRQPLGQNWPYAVRRNQLTITFQRGTGKGGQKKNKTSSACRIVHNPTGIMTYCEAHREQSANRDAAFRKLAEKLVPIMKQKISEEKHQDTRPETDANLVVRTYHAIRRLVRDHRIDKKQFDYKKTLDGELDPIIREII